MLLTHNIIVIIPKDIHEDGNWDFTTIIFIVKLRRQTEKTKLMYVIHKLRRIKNSVWRVMLRK